MPTSLAGTGDWWGAGRTLRRAGEPEIGGRGRGLGRPPEPRPRPEGWQPLTVHCRSRSGSPRKGGRTGTSGGVDRTDQLCGEATSGSPPTSGGRPSRERTATRSASGGVAMATARAPRGGGLCESLGLRARRGQGSGVRRRAAGSPMGLSRSKHKPEKGKGKGPPGAPGGVRTREGLGVLGVPPLQILTTRESSLVTVPQESFHPWKYPCLGKWSESSLSSSLISFWAKAEN